MSAPNVDCLYQIPIEFADQGLIDRIVHKLRLRSAIPSINLPNYNTFKHFTSILHDPTNPVVRIAFVGKYVTGGSDAYFSVIQCFEHCQLALHIRLDVLYMESEDLEGPNAMEA